MGEEECFYPAKWLFTKTYQIGCRFPTRRDPTPLQDTEGNSGKNWEILKEQRKNFVLQIDNLCHPQKKVFLSRSEFFTIFKRSSFLQIRIFYHLQEKAVNSRSKASSV